MTEVTYGWFTLSELGLVLLKQTICQNIKGISVYQLMTTLNVPRVKLNSFFCYLIMEQVAEYCKEHFLWTNLKETSTCFHFLICHYMSAGQNLVSLLCFKCFFKYDFCAAIFVRTP